jgi:hypothetical protein
MTDFDAVTPILDQAWHSALRGQPHASVVREALAALDAAHPRAAWSQLRALDWEGDLRGSLAWFANLLHSKPPGEDVNGLWFGLFRPVRGDETLTDFYVSGSRVAPEQDWPSSSDGYWPEGRYRESPVLAHAARLEPEDDGDLAWLIDYGVGLLHLRGTVLHLLQEVPIATWLGETPERYVALGHDSGEHETVARVTSDGVEHLGADWVTESPVKRILAQLTAFDPDAAANTWFVLTATEGAGSDRPFREQRSIGRRFIEEHTPLASSVRLEPVQARRRWGQALMDDRELLLCSPDLTAALRRSERSGTVEWLEAPVSLGHEVRTYYAPHFLIPWPELDQARTWMTPVAVNTPVVNLTALVGAPAVLPDPHRRAWGIAVSADVALELDEAGLLGGLHVQRMQVA